MNARSVPIAIRPNAFRTLTRASDLSPAPSPTGRGENFSLVLSAPLPRRGRGRGLGLSARDLSPGPSPTGRALHNYFAERVPSSPRPFFYGRGRAARRLLSFCKRGDARVRVQQAIGAHACSAPSPGRRGLRKNIATRVPARPLPQKSGRGDRTKPATL